MKHGGSMEYKSSGEVRKRGIYSANVTSPMGGQPQRMTDQQGSMMSGNQGQMMPGGQPQMMPGGHPQMMPGGQPQMMPGGQPQMMPWNQGQMMPWNQGQMMPGGNCPMMMPGQRRPMIYPPNMVMPYYYGDTLQGMEIWNESDVTEEALDKELELVMEMYPSSAKEIQKKVTEVCDSLDYDGSILYDEYPDKFVLSRYCDKIYEDMEASQVEMASENKDSQDVSSMARPGGDRRPPCRDCRPNDGRRDLIDVLFFNEIFRRRCRRGRCQRW